MPTRRSSPRHSRFLGLIACAAVTLFAQSVRADIAPPPGWKESCTEDQQKKPGEECLSCSAYYGNVQHCSKLLASYEFESRCKTRGASVWSELWCRKSSPSAKKVPPNIMAALSNSTDDGGGDGGTTAPTVAPTVTPDAAPTVEPSTTTTTAPSTTAAPSTKLPTDDAPKKGACGACVIGGAGSSSGAIMAFALALGICLVRRRAR
jgi:hypothetical protein